MQPRRSLLISTVAALSFGIGATASIDAHAAVPTSGATFFISNGFLNDLGTIDGIRTVQFGRIGTLVENGNSWAVSMDLTCDHELSTDYLDCSGTLTLDGVSADISAGHDDGDGYWAIEAVPTALKNAHIAMMRSHIWVESQDLQASSLPPGWSLIDIGAAVLWYEYDWDWYLAPWDVQNPSDPCYWDVFIECE